MITVVSRHVSTIDLISGFLNKIGLKKYYKVVEHVEEPGELTEIVIGNIPLTMFLESDNIHTLILVSLEIPKELRGRELGLDELKKHVRFVVLEKTIVYYTRRGKEYGVRATIVDNLDGLKRFVIW